MTVTDVYQIKNEIEPKIRSGYVTSRVLLARSRFLDDSSRKTSAFNDPGYFPFYYYLSSLFRPEKVLELGVGLGLRASCVCRGSDVKEFYGVYFGSEGEGYYPRRLVYKNIKDYCKGKVSLEIKNELNFNFKEDYWDLVVVGEQVGGEVCRKYLDSVWGSVKFGGIVAVEHGDSNSKEIDEFCRSKNRGKVSVKTRYGVYLIEK